MRKSYNFILQSYLKQVLMEKDIQIKHVESNLVFGKLTDTPHIQFIRVLDITQEQISVPCTSLQITVAQFIQFYFKNTNSSKFFSQQPLLIIDQGSKKQKFAQDNDIISGFGFDLKKNCFRIVDKAQISSRQREDIQQERAEDERRLRGKEQNQRGIQNDQVELNIIIINFSEKFKLKIDLNEKVIDLKKKAISQILYLKNFTPDLLNLRYKESSISNDNERLSKYQIVEGSTLIIKVKQSSGCFSSESLVLLANKEQAKISEIKKGDQIVSYNMQKNTFQTDKVSFIKRCRVQQSLQIVFSDQTKLKTTANHLFLCQDNQFRCYTTDIFNPDASKALKLGTKLKTAEKTLKQIKEMYCSRQQFQDGQFYHLSVEKNHNFIVNGLITHNMFIKIKLAKGEEKIDVNPASSITQIKERLQQVYFIQIHNQILLYGGKQLGNQSTIADNNIPKQATLQLLCKKTYHFNLIKEEVPVLLANGNYVPAAQLKKGDSLAIFDTTTGKKGKGSDLIQFIEEIYIDDYFYFGLGEYQNTVGLSVNSYVELQNGEAVNVRDICYQLCQTATLRTINGETVDVKGMAHINQPHRKKKFYKISMLSNKNLVAKQIIVHDKVVNLLLMRGEKRYKKISFGVNSGDKVQLIKSKLSKLINIPQKDIILLHNQHQLSPQRTIESYDIQTQHLVLAIIQASISKLSKNSLFVQAEAEVEKIQTKMINLQVSQTQKELLNYYEYKGKTIEEILKTFLPNDNSAYFFTFDDMLLFPNDKLSRLQQSPNFKYSENTIVLVKNEKLSFINAMNIGKQEVGNYSSIKKKVAKKSYVKGSEIMVKLDQFEHQKQVIQAASRIKNDNKILADDFKEKQFFLPFLYLTCRKFSEKIKRHIMNFQQYRSQQNRDSQMFQIIKGAYINMQLLPNYYRKCFLGVKNFKFSNFFKKDQTFYLHNFTIAFKKEDLVMKELKKKLGTFFHITSLNGKDISRFSMFPDEEEVLFAPFTPFLIEQIIPGEFFDEVYIVQLSAPITFQKDIILWVDDQPYRNEADIKKILSKLDIEILQATSTLQAEKWIKEFGWLLNWKGLQFKIISDMVRYEGVARQGSQRKPNYTAGIDLLRILYNKHGFNVKTLIYCGKQKEAKEAARNAELKHEKNYQITSSQPKMFEFFNISKK